MFQIKKWGGQMILYPPHFKKWGGFDPSDAHAINKVQENLFVAIEPLFKLFNSWLNLSKMRYSVSYDDNSVESYEEKTAESYRNCYVSEKCIVSKISKISILNINSINWRNE